MAAPGHGFGPHHNWKPLHCRTSLVANGGHAQKYPPMNTLLHDRFLDWRNAFQHPVTTGITLGIVAILVITPLVVLIFAALGRVKEPQRTELFKRYYTW